MTASSLRGKSPVASPAQSDLYYQAMGLLITMVVPAAFWTVVIAGIGNLAGVEMHPTSLWLLAAAIAAFCGTGCAPLIFRTR